MPSFLFFLPAKGNPIRVLYVEDHANMRSIMADI